MNPLLTLAREAGDILMLHYAGEIAVERKQDRSPVTKADREADAHILAGLRRLFPEIPIVSEEGVHDLVQHASAFWLVDPLDGTRSFIRKRGYFTVNIGLVSRCGETGAFHPLAGVIYEPVAQALYWGCLDQENGGGEAFLARGDAAAQPIRCRAPAAEGVRDVSSSSTPSAKMTDYLARHRVMTHDHCASSLKFCLLAEGHYDLYPRFGPTMEWDTAAGHAILAAAGGRVMDEGGKPFLYGKAGFLNGAFIAAGR
jgi:3'(2'), 5'-bisphosphate nucleotidase